MTIEIEELASKHRDSLGQFAEALGPGDVAIIKEDISNSEVLDGWTSKQEGRRWVAVEDGTVVGFGALSPKSGWSSHVDELRLVTHPGHRRKGVGRLLAQDLLKKAIDAGMEKVMVEVVAEDEGTISLFRGLGFQPEALLIDHIKDRQGETHDLVLLGHNVAEVRGALESLGAAESL